MIATRPPLRLDLNVADLTTSPGSSERTVQITDATLSGERGELESEEERRIAFFLMRFGDWEVEDSVRLDSEGAVEAIEIVLTPGEGKADLLNEQGFVMIGTLSSMYSQLYNEITLTDQGRVREMRHEPVPGELAELIPGDYWERPDRRLPIWRFEVKPS
jgi:hypothetical protein